MAASRYIGRIGALAVALGIGAAMTTGAGIALADESSSTSESSTDSPARPKPGDRIAAKLQRIRDAATATATATPSATSAGQSQQPPGDGAAEPQGETTQSTAKRGDRLSAWAARLQARADRFASDLVTAPGSNTRVLSLPGRDGDSETPRTIPSSDRLKGLTQPTKRRQGITPDGVAPSNLLDRSTEPAAVRGIAQLTDWTPILASAKVIASSAESTVRVPTLRVSAAVTDLAHAAPAAAATTKTVVSGLLIVAGLSPLAGNGPALPAHSPLAWALAAWTRRVAEKDSSGEDRLRSVAHGQSQGVTEPVPQVRQEVALASAVSPSADPGYVLSGAQGTKPSISGSLSAKQMGWTTGRPTAPWVVGGTDLGIMWVGGTQNGTPVVYALFGDTFDQRQRQTGWRNNVLFRTTDLNLSNGLSFDTAIVTPGGTGPGSHPEWNQWWGPSYPNGLKDKTIGAAQVILDPVVFQKNQGFSHLGKAYTMIPTAGIAIGDPGAGPEQVTQYATVMSIKQWGAAGHWTTNYSAIAKSTDGGKTWTVLKDTVRESNKDPNFQQNALVYGKDGDVDADDNRYIYVYGTPAGRQGSAYVARVPENQFEDLSAYQYYAGEQGGQSKWVTGDPSAATAVIGTAGNRSILPQKGILGFFVRPVEAVLNFILPGLFKPGGLLNAGGRHGNVSELSVQYNPYLDKYVAMYTDGSGSVVMRVSDTPQGVWSDTVTVQEGRLLGSRAGMYAPMIHPLSGTGQLDGGANEQYLYYNLSQWNDYNVRMMRTDLSRLTLT